MNTPFPYDVAISCVAEDALTARHLTGRLRHRLDASVFDPASLGGTAGEIPAAILRHDVRVVIVLHQRLWGHTPSTQTDRDAIADRVAREGSGFLVVVSLEPGADVPPCLRAKGTTCVSLSLDGVGEVDVIAAAVRRAGGSSGPALHHPSARRAGARDGESDGAPSYDSPQSAAKTALAAQRETDVVIAEIEAGIKAARAASPDTTLGVRRSPDRCVVQAGDIGLSVSWLRPASVIPEGALLIIEWAGTVTLPGEQTEPRCRAIVVGEHQLHLELLAPRAPAQPVAWNWWSDGAPMRKYSSRDLGALCVHRLLRRVEEAATE